MSSLVGDDITKFSRPIKILLRARIKKEERTKHFRDEKKLSRRYPLTDQDLKNP